MASIFNGIRNLFLTPAHPETPAEVKSTAGVVVPQQTPLYDGKPIIAYPDKGVAAPSASPEMLYQSQLPLIDRLQQSSSFSHDDFNDLLKPAILNYAAYVHMLPASETNHHCGQGGLFRHGLEVALNASNACVGKVFAWDSWASERERLIPRWRMCAILGGMLHDMGKPMVDVGAIDESGDLNWNPHNGSLYQWLVENNLPHYYIHWRPGARHKRHEAFNQVTLYRIIPEKTMRWLTEFGGQEPLDYMVMSLSGSSDPRNTIAAIIKKADSDSVDRDIRDSRQRLSASGLGGARNLAARIVRTMYDQIEGGKWLLNKPSSPVYLTDQGIFGMYPAIINEAIDILRESGETSLPRDSASVLDLLSDWSYIAPNTYSNGQTTNTWNVRLHLEDRGAPMITTMHVICFAREEIIPNTLLPPTKIHAEILGQDGKPRTDGSVRLAPPQDVKKPSKVETQLPPDNQGTTMVPGIPTPVDNNELHLYQVKPPSSGLQPIQEDNDIPEQTSTFEASPAENDDSVELRDRSTEKDPHIERIDKAVQNYTKIFPPTTREDALKWLAANNPEGEYLIHIARRLHRRQLVEGEHVFELKNHIYLKSPDAFEDLGLDPIDLRTMFEEKHWTQSDSPSRTTVIYDLGKKKIPCTRLTEDMSTVFLLLMPSKNEETQSSESSLDSPKPKRLCLGPFIDQHTAERIISLTKVEKKDTVIIRPIVYRFLQDTARTDDFLLDTITTVQLKDLLQAFQKQHRLNYNWLIRHLTGDDNQLIAPTDASLPVIRSEFILNPEYNATLDYRADPDRT